MKTRIVIVILLLYLSLSVGCSRTYSDSMLSDQSTDGDILFHESNSTDSEIIIEKELNIDTQSRENDKQVPKEDDESSTSRKYVYYEDTIQTLLGYKHYSGNGPLRAFPYEDSPVVSELKEYDVNVISTVRNENNEHWALVQTENRINNYGFVRAEDIKDVEDRGVKTKGLNVPISIESIKIGDLLEKAISVLGLDYVNMSGKERGFIHYGEIDGSDGMMLLGKGIDIFYNLYTHEIWRIRINKEVYSTLEGYGVGSNAMKAVEHYRSRFPMNGDKSIMEDSENFNMNAGKWSFDVGSEYVLKFEIDTDDLTDESKITEIELAPKWWFAN